ncbi:hypothetical protein RHGRI_037535 [Rhododendron griersonianum]|uniref:Uncharacterized protein n=1 Tax=Rhododendron griersonianum TaxID=479676 RepID=A0AAV6HXJ1_9ERIC|nr:hypothetical protein RHGRI_037535 [Rhododendron griersonianum]
MGCCPSSPYKADAAADSTHEHRHSSAARPDPSCRSRTAAAVAPPEEETVKEVLSETPIAKISEKDDKQRVLMPLQKQDDPKKNINKKTPSFRTEEASEVSDIRSLSELSVSTAADKRDDDGVAGGEEVRQRVAGRSPAKFRNRERRDRVAAGGKSPTRRSDPSPGRVRSVSGRERAVPADGKRQDSGESSRRRSMSPATRATEMGCGRAGMGRTSSARRTGKSPGRMHGKAHPTQKFEENEEGEVPGDSNKWQQPPTTDESLENPLVSLECFIFL